MQVFIRDNNVDQALRVLKKKMQREGVFREMKRRRFYEKPSERANREQAEAIRRSRKAARKKPNARDLSPHRPERRRYRTADRADVARSRSQAEFSGNRDGKVHLSRWDTMSGYLTPNVSSVLCFRLLAQAPKLKAFRIDCFLDRVAREVVRRIIVR